MGSKHLLQVAQFGKILNSLALAAKPLQIGHLITYKVLWTFVFLVNFKRFTSIPAIVS